MVMVKRGNRLNKKKVSGQVWTLKTCIMAAADKLRLNSAIFVQLMLILGTVKP